CVYASPSADTPAFLLTAAARLGELLTDGSHVCVNGGGRSGGMGALNAAVVKGKGEIISVSLKRWARGRKPFSREQMIVIEDDDLADWKRRLRDASDVVIVLLGGAGTLDELFDLVALRGTGMSSLPICLVNIASYYNGLVMQHARARAEKVASASL
ncbi:hypothetical protein T492DRAFT_573763, partial [Pavlovales sp. CCMP2436]